MVQKMRLGGLGPAQVHVTNKSPRQPTPVPCPQEFDVWELWLLPRVAPRPTGLAQPLVLFDFATDGGSDQLVDMCGKGGEGMGIPLVIP